MKPFRLFALLAVATVVGASSAQADGGGCVHTNLVFYTTDSTDLAKGLGASPSTCADYWISISPITAVGPDTGKARGGTPLTTIHAQGPQFHALAELRPKQWYDFAVTQGHGWLAAGKALRDSMLGAGYDPARDTWAVNEVGTPSDSTVNTDVFDGAGGARDGFRQFVEGLYEGSSGPAMPGVVFAANPPQLAPGIGAYERGLAGWYADAPFWQDMGRTVRFWAQETYADVRAWGVAGSTLDERTSYLNDYFLHALRLPGAAHDFLSHAYVPISNASWRQTSPPPAGPGFGSTDVPIATMKAFISAQTYALRVNSVAQFGYAVVPKNAGTDRAPLEAYLGSAIAAADPCAAGACAADVDGAAFTTAWRTFATPPIVTPHVDGPQAADGWYTGDVNVTWDVADPETGIDSSSGCDPVTLTEDTAGTTITCTATSLGGTTTKSVTIARDTTPPTITPHVRGPLGTNGWYVGDVTVTWDVTDSLSPATTCPATTITEDTAGTPVTCTASSDGGESTATVLVQRDATPPTATCTATPSTIWPPNGKLVPVTVTIAAADETSGTPGGRTDERLVRAVKDAVYTWSYEVHDLAGNAATCDVTVTVPHDRRG